MKKLNISPAKSTPLSLKKTGFKGIDALPEDEIVALSDIQDDEVQYYDSDLCEDKEDYLLKGLSAARMQDIPKWMQEKMMKQKLMAKRQGGVKYIAPVMGKKAKIVVDQQTYRNENFQNKHYAVEFYKWDKLAG